MSPAWTNWRRLLFGTDESESPRSTVFTAHLQARESDRANPGYTHPGARSKAAADAQFASITDLDPEFALGGPGLGDVDLDLTQAPIVLDADSCSVRKGSSHVRLSSLLP